MSFFVLLITVSFCDAAPGMDEAQDKTKMTINIGIYAPFSNESAYIGRNMLGAMEIARDQLKSSEINYEFYTLDRMPNNARTAKTVQKFIEAHHINVLLTEGTESGTLVAPLAKKIISFIFASQRTQLLPMEKIIFKHKAQITNRLLF